MTNEPETNEQVAQQTEKPERRWRRAPKGMGYYAKCKDRPGFEWQGTLGEGGPRISLYAPTMRQLMAKVEEARKAYSNGLPLMNPTLAEFAAYWLRDVIKPNTAPRTYQSYELTSRLHLVPTLGHIRLTALTAQHVKTFSAPSWRKRAWSFVPSSTSGTDLAPF